MNASATATSSRRHVLGAALGLLAGAAGVHAQGSATPAEVWKDPSCGCCKDWVAHLEANGFKVKVHESGNGAARSRLGIDRKYASCHTGLVGGYALEGHVPAREIRRLLAERPKAIGLSVPGMPVGAPGMDGEVYGQRHDAFDVMLLARDGSASVYRHYDGNKAAQGAASGPVAAAPASSARVGAEVRRIDWAGKKIMLAHGKIEALDMPAMTMEFRVRDARTLDALKPGDRIRFLPSRESGVLVASEISSAP